VLNILINVFYGPSRFMIKSVLWSCKCSNERKCLHGIRMFRFDMSQKV